MSCQFWVGNYGDMAQPTVLQMSYDPERGFRTEQSCAGLSNPSFVLAHPGGKILYTVEENEAGAVCAWAITEKGLALQNRIPTEGSYPCHLALSEDGRWLYAANYGSGSVACFALTEEGSLYALTDLRQHEGHGPNPDRQEGPHAHCCLPVGNRVYVCDLGLDRIMVYENDNGTLRDAGHLPFPAGTGPRHLARRPGQPDQLYCVAELSGEVFRIALRADGLGEIVQCQETIPENFKGETTAAAIHFTEDGSKLLVSQRGMDQIAVFEVQEDGSLREPVLSDCLRIPRDFLIHGDQILVGSQQDGDLRVYTLEGNRLIPAEHRMQLICPVCLQKLYG